MKTVARLSAEDRSDLFRNTANRINDWKNIPEQYWNMALEEMKVPK